MTPEEENQLLRGILVGAVALLLLSIVRPDIFYEFLMWAVSGSVLSAFFLVPVDRMIITGKLQVKDAVGFAVGAGIFVYLFLFVYETTMDGVVFLLEWLVAYNLISVLTKYLPLWTS